MDTLSSDKLIIPADKLLLAKPPDGYEYKLVPKEKSELEKLQEQLVQVEAELEGMTEPSAEELIEAGKIMHPYYEALRRKAIIQEMINNL